MKLIIQVPCYNEAETLEIALNHLPKHIDGIDEIEYLIINDGSRDDTVKVAKNWGVNYVVNFRTNRGLAKGFMAGLDACLRNGADIIVNTDADDQYCGCLLYTSSASEAIFSLAREKSGQAEETGILSYLMLWRV